MPFVIETVREDLLALKRLRLSIGISLPITQTHWTSISDSWPGPLEKVDSIIGFWNGLESETDRIGWEIVPYFWIAVHFACLCAADGVLRVTYDTQGLSRDASLDPSSRGGMSSDELRDLVHWLAR